MTIPRALPPAEAISCDAIREALANAVAARDAANEAKAALVLLEQTRPQAERADAEALANALGRVGRPPHPTHLAEHDKTLAAARLKSQACEINADRAADEFDQAFAEHGDEWREQLAAQRMALLAEKNRQADELVATLARIRTLLAIQGFAHGQQRYDERKYSLAVAAPPPGDYDRVQVDWLVESLRSVGQPPAPQPVAAIA